MRGVKRYGGNKPSKWWFISSSCHYFSDNFTTLPSLCIVAVVRSYTGDAYNWNHQLNSKLKTKKFKPILWLELNTFYKVLSFFHDIWIKYNL
jgi:hypothetical protein